VLAAGFLQEDRTMEKPTRKFVEPDSLLAEICNRIADAIEDAFGWQARALNAGQVKEIIERTCAEWYDKLPSDSTHFISTVVKPRACQMCGMLLGHSENCLSSARGLCDICGQPFGAHDRQCQSRGGN
jgi:hypothetical protein